MAGRHYAQPDLEVDLSRQQCPSAPTRMPSSYEYEGLQAIEFDNERNKVPSDVFSTTLYQKPPLPSGYRPVNQQPEADFADKAAAPRKRILAGKKRILLAVAVICLIIITIVVGVAVGVSLSKRAKDSTSASGENNIFSPSEMSGTGTYTSAAPALAPTAVSWGYPHLDVFVLNKNKTGSIYRKYRNANTTEANIKTFQPSGKDLESHPNANGISNRGVDTVLTPSMAVAKRVLDGQNYTSIHIADAKANGFGYRDHWVDNDYWTLWGKYNMKFDSSPSQVTYDEGKMDKQGTFFVNKNGDGDAVYFTSFQDREYLDATPIRGPRLFAWATPAVVAWNGDDTRLDVFTVSWPSHVVVQATRDIDTNRNDSWTTFRELGGFCVAPPTAVTRAPGTIDLFVQGGDRGVWHLAYSDETGVKWGNWTAVGGATRVQGQPSAISMSSDTVDLFAWGEDGAMLRATYNSTAKTWSPEAGFTTVVSTKLLGPPSVMTDGSGDINVFAYSQDEELIWTRLRPGETTGEAVVLANVPYLKDSPS